MTASSRNGALARPSSASSPEGGASKHAAQAAAREFASKLEANDQPAVGRFTPAGYAIASRPSRRRSAPVLLSSTQVFAAALLLAFGPPDALTVPRPPPEPIVGGSEVEGTDHIETVYLRIGEVACTGTFIEENLIITAGHCLASNPDPSRMCVLLGDEVVPTACWGSAGRADVVSYGVHPDYCRECDKDATDIGYVLIEGRVTGIDFPTVITDAHEYHEMMHKGAKVEMVGYGYDESGSADGKKRQVNAEITEFIADGREFFAGGKGKDTCQGDSGGPVFMLAKDGFLRLVGITSRGYPECGEGGLYTAPFEGLCWIRDETGVDLLPEGCEDCDCVDLSDTGGCGGGCSSDPSGGLGPLALLVLLRRRRGRKGPAA